MNILNYEQDYQISLKSKFNLGTSQVNSGIFLPKCPKVAVLKYIGLFKFNSFIIFPGLKLKFLFIILMRLSSVRPSFTVPYESTVIEIGSGRPIAYDT